MRDVPTQRFSFADWRGEVAAEWRPTDLEAAVRRVADPAAAERTLHWGRNYLYVVRWPAASGPVEAVVKQFRNQGLRARWRRRRGSKAERAFAAARALVAAGLRTPAPVAVVESTAREGPSLYLSLLQPHDFELRYFLRALSAGSAAAEYPGVSPAELLAALGGLAARLHAAGVWHRDWTSGNVLVRDPHPGAEPELWLLDLNRARLGRRLGLWRRLRELARMPILRREHQAVYLESYFGRPARRAELGLYQLAHAAFLAKNRWKRGLRRATAGVGARLRPRRAHVHIPPPPPGAGPRDRAVWDPLSDQPHQHARRGERLLVRLADIPLHLEETSAVAAALPRIARRFRELRRDLHARPVAWQEPGVCLTPWPRAPEELLRAVEELGVRRLLLRLHPWQDDHGAEEELARELHRRGHELAFALPQNRELVRDPGRWRAAVAELAGRFTPFGRHFQVGQAINRSKWGIWNLREYAALADAACEELRRHPGVEILGPAVIDFEYHSTAAALNQRRGDYRFDAVSALLYVDRRGAPENRQLGFTTVDKVVLLRAIAETSRRAGPRCWVTEFNWPLREGPHAPAGRAVAVDEQRQADYLARYYLLALGTGLLERAYWWQLVAKGYGLLDPGEAGELRRRPAFHALAALARRLSDTSFLGPLPAPPGAHLYRFAATGGGEWLAGWSVERPLTLELPRPVEAVLGRDGAALRSPAGTRVEVSSAPSYFRLRD
jgi:hypothetical protein